MFELLILAIAPAVFILIYFYMKDRYEPEPLGWIVKVFLLGAVMVIPAFILEAPFPPGLYVAVVVAPIVEESLKFAAVYFTVYRDEEFSEPVDGIVYAVAAALGFATIENILYVLEGGLGTGILRAFVSVPGHALDSAIWGYTLGLARFSPPKDRPLLIGSGLAGSMFFHGAFNLLASDSALVGFVLLVALLVPVSWWLVHRNIGQALRHPESEEGRGKKRQLLPPAGEESPGKSSDTEKRGGSQPPPGRYCTECGALLSPSAKFCKKCGRPVDVI